MTHTINLDDFLKNHILTNLKIHPDGKFGLYFDNTLDFDGDKYDRKVFLINLETFESELLDLEALQEVTIEENGRQLAVRSRCVGTCGKIFQAVGVALPPSIREV